jgi:hypothetical protein
VREWEEKAKPSASVPDSNQSLATLELDEEKERQAFQEAVKAWRNQKVSQLLFSQLCVLNLVMKSLSLA